MISLNDVLLAMSNIPVDDPIAEIWGRGLQGGYKIIKHTGTIPITITANGDALIDYRIYGADGRVGEPTENLFDKNTITPNSFFRENGEIGSTHLFSISDFIHVENGDYLIHNARSGYTGVYNCIYDENKNFVRSIVASLSDLPITIGDNEKYIRISVNSSNDNLNRLNVCMVVKGTTAPTEYIPYGYKLPMKQHSANWFDKDSFHKDDFSPLGGGLFSYITGLKPNVDYTMSATNTGTEYIWYGGSGALERQLPRTVKSNEYGEIYFGIYRYTFNDILQNDNIMVVEGSTPALYIPYSGTDTPVYIGENQLDSVEGVSDYVDKSSGKIVRMIGEYTFTGDESFDKYGNSDVFYTSKTIDPVGITTVNTITMRCNHPAFTAIENKDTRYWLNPEADDICCFLPGGRSQVFFRSTSNFATATECKAYLKAQYDNGTPVKISYWLKTPVEEDPPVPLPEIPTINGETIIDYDGTPKPSQMYIKYKSKG